MHYFDIDLDRAWAVVGRYVPDARWPAGWQKLLDQHPAWNKFSLRETPALVVRDEELPGLYTRTDKDGRFTYDPDRAVGYAATLCDCRITGFGADATEAFSALAGKAEALYNKYEELGWPPGLETSPIGHGHAKPEMRVLRQLMRKG